MDTFDAGLLVALVTSVLAVGLFIQLWRGARRSLSEARSSKHSLSTKYGQMTEQFMPFVPDYPWDPQSFRFIGSPIDGVQFEDDKVIIVEFKTGSSKLSERQRHIRDLIRDGRVEFEEFRID